MWNWIAGMAVLALIAVITIAGWNGNQQSHSRAPINLGNCKMAKADGPHGLLQCEGGKYFFTLVQ